jgi:thioredoxin-related protein
MSTVYAAALALGLALSTPAMTAEMIMFEQAGCAWCQRFNKEIAPAWPKTEQGQRAPLRHVDIHQPLPEDLADIPIERFTPTFVLVEDGREIARLRGYPGDQFFWALVDEMLAKLEQ